MQVEETTTSTMNTSLKPTRASFIRSLPIEMPVEEVIERGRELGIVVQPSDVHAARYYMRQASAAEAASKPPTIAQQLMLGGTISARETPRVDETAGLTKIAGVRNGASRAAGGKPVTPTTPSAATAPVIQVEPAVRAGRAGRAANGSKRQAAPPSPKKERAARAAARGEISIDEVLKAVTAPKTRGGRRVPNVSASLELEEQLHNVALRLGTQRAREILDRIEELALSAS